MFHFQSEYLNKGSDNQLIMHTKLQEIYLIITLEKIKTFGGNTIELHLVVIQ